MSLPYLLGHGLAEIAALARSNPYLWPDPQEVARVKARLDRLPGFKVGINWQGNPRHSNDRERSIAIDRFEGLMALEGVTPVSLQTINRERDIDPYIERFGALDWPEEKAGFYPLACLIKALDLVVTCDSAVAHVAGALGVPTWLLLPVKLDWRWLLRRSDSPWYPSFRLFRQTQPLDWGPVFSAVEQALGAEIEARRPSA